MDVAITRNPSPTRFFLLLLVLSLPFWLAGALTDLRILPGLPVSSLGVLCMVGAASILVHREAGWPGVAALLRRSFDLERIGSKLWLAPALLVMPAIYLLSYLVLRFSAQPLPAARISLLPALVLFAVFFIAALGEELGWSGYAIDPLQKRFGALGGALVLGLVWAAWHLLPLLSVHRGPEWIAWWCLGTLATRVLITWLYDNTGRSVFVAALCHASSNLAWQLFPVNGSHYDPRVTGLITLATAIVVVLVFGPKTLVRELRR